MGANIYEVLQNVPTEMLEAEIIRRRDTSGLALMVAQCVAKVFFLSPVEIVKKSRAGRVIKPRQMAMTICRQRGMTLADVAAFFGCSCHAAVIHATRRNTRDLVDIEYWEARQSVLEMLSM